MSKLNPKLQLARHDYPIERLFWYSNDDAAKLYELYSQLSRTYDALALSGGYDPDNLTEEDCKDIAEVIDSGQEDEDGHLKRWHELRKQIGAIETKYQAQSIAKIKKGGG